MINKFERNVLISTGFLTMLFVFSILYAKKSRDIDLPQCLPFDKAYTEPKIVQLDSNLYQVYAVAQMWLFQPAEIKVPVGSTVDFFLTSKDVVHGFHLYKRNVNMMAIFGGITKTTVKFDAPGVYTITCHEYCGIGHQNMQSEIIVNNPSK